MSQDYRKGILWSIRVVIAIVFILAGGPKILKDPNWVQNFQEWGYPDWFRMLVGWVEILGALALVNNRTVSGASAGLAMVMFGATVTRFVNGDWQWALPPLAISILLIIVAMAYRPHPVKGELEDNEYADYEGEPDHIKV